MALLIPWSRRMSADPHPSNLLTWDTPLYKEERALSLATAA
jgi:hypothetical protein